MKYSNLDENKICQMYEDGKSTHEISKLLDISNTPIKRILRKNNIKLRNVGHPKIYSCNEDFFKEESEESFYLAGFIAADGSLRQQKYSKVLKITLSTKDKEHLEKMKSLLNSNAIIKYYKTTINNNIIHNNKTKKSNYDNCELNITSKIIFDDLQKFNIVPNKTENYKIPQWLYEHKYFKHFIRGYIDGDGSISATKTKQCNNLQTSISLIGNYQVVDIINNYLIKSCNINGSTINHKPGTKHTYRIRFSGNLQNKKIGTHLYENTNIYLERKFNKIKWLL